MFHQRLTAVLAEKKMYAAEFARLMGRSPQTINNWIKGKREPDLETISEIAQKLEVSILVLVPDRDDLKQKTADQLAAKLRAEGIGIDEATAHDKTKYITLPVLDVEPSAGHGAIAGDEAPVDGIMFKEEWLREQLQISPAHLQVLRVSGTSMEPTLHAGDLMIVDVSPQENIIDGVYVVRLDGALMVKRIQRLPGNNLEIISDNTAYRAFQIGPSRPPNEFRVCGRVVWAGRRM